MRLELHRGERVRIEACFLNESYVNVVHLNDVLEYFEDCMI